MPAAKNVSAQQVSLGNLLCVCVRARRTLDKIHGMLLDAAPTFQPKQNTMTTRELSCEHCGWSDGEHNNKYEEIQAGKVMFLSAL